MVRPSPELLRILDGRFLPNDIPGIARPVPVVGVHGFALDSPHALANQVVAENLPAGAAEVTIEAVISFFAERGSAFQWLVHTEREPVDLVRRLQDRGFSRIARFAGMVLSDLHAPIPTAVDVTVRAIDRDEAVHHTGILERGFDLPAGAVAAYSTYRSRLPAAYRLASYLAYVAGRAEPIAYGESLRAPDTSTVLLGGAATEATFRGRGAYRGLLARRVADARAEGATKVAILAERFTSARICARVGFREVAALEAWAWRPSEADQGDEQLANESRLASGSRRRPV